MTRHFGNIFGDSIDCVFDENTETPYYGIDFWIDKKERDNGTTIEDTGKRPGRDREGGFHGG